MMKAAIHTMLAGAICGAAAFSTPVQASIPTNFNAGELSSLIYDGGLARMRLADKTGENFFSGDDSAPFVGGSSIDSGNDFDSTMLKIVSGDNSPGEAPLITSQISNGDNSPSEVAPSFDFGSTETIVQIESGLTFTTVQIGVPVLATFPLPVSGVPEPASWATMIGGLATIGGALRRRKPSVRVHFA